MPIMKLSVWKMIVGEVVAFGFRLLGLLQGRPANDPHLGDTEKLLGVQVDDVSSAYDRSGPNPVTVTVGVAKRALDAALAQGVSGVRAQCRCIDETTADAAASIYPVLKRHNFGAPVKSNYVQSASVMAMLKELGTPEMQAAIATAKVQDALAPIAPAHAAFEDALKQKVIANAPAGESLVTMTNRLRHTLASTVDYLNRREILYPDVYKPLNEQVNELVAEVTVNVRTRQTKENAANNKPTPAPVAPPVTPPTQVVTPPAQTVTPAVTPTPPATPAATTPTPEAPPAAPADQSTTTPPAPPKADAAPEAGRLAA